MRLNSACMLRKLTAMLIPLLAALTPPYAVSAQLSIAGIFTPAPPWGAQPENIMWAPGSGSFLYMQPLQDGSASPLRQYDVARGDSRIVVDPASYGVPAATPTHVSWSPDGKNIAFVIRSVLYVRDMATGFERRVATDVTDALWSPQNNAIAYVRNADLYVGVMLPRLHSLRLTGGGAPAVMLNGDVDWVYHEEFATAHGFAWAPDGASIAYMQTDERDVTNFPIVDFSRPDNRVTYQRYPLAGERNPRVSVHVVELRTLASRLVYDAGARDEYVPVVGWSPQNGSLLIEILDRAQKQLRVDQWQNAARRTLYRQSDSKWVEAIPLPVWYSRNESLWILERDNVWGLYRRSARGRLQRINGSYRVDEIFAVDAAKRVAYAYAAFPSRRDRSLLAFPIAGGPPQNLTPSSGTHVVSLAPSNDLFVDTHSTLIDPPQTELVSVTGRTRAVLVPRSETLRAQLMPVRMLTINSGFGPLDATMILPEGFDASRRYPVVMYTYGGPEAPVTQNVFGYARGLYHHLLARSGIIVFSIDGPGSQYDNAAHVRLMYHALGPGSLAGQEAGVAYLRSLPYVDPLRIGIWGWSFGGYEAVYALTHSTDFKAAAAGAPVTDWRYYDSIYTERYMGPPQNNAAAYDESSAVNAAAALHGDLIISHGTADDNVHFANTIAFVRSLISADRLRVDVIPYPGQKHHFEALEDLRGLYTHMLEWWTTHL